MNDETVTWEWSWRRLSLWRNTKRRDGSGGGSSRIFSLWPADVWFYFRWRQWQDPFDHCARWLKRNRHWDDEDFHRAVCWYYANGSEPGELVRLNVRLLK